MSVARRRMANSLETAPRALELKVGQIGAAGTDRLGNDRRPCDNIILMSAKKSLHRMSARNREKRVVVPSEA